tara:strand:- start:235 stop:525 length:291 start_codon:yes stop_codon:yes gene_type:complete
MKSYLKGLITGGMLVLSSLVFMGQSKDNVISVMETQTEIMKKLVEHEDMLLKMSENNDALKLSIKEELIEFEKEQHVKNLYLTSYLQYLDKRVTIK